MLGKDFRVCSDKMWWLRSHDRENSIGNYPLIEGDGTTFTVPIALLLCKVNVYCQNCQLYNLTFNNDHGIILFTIRQKK